MFAPNLSTSYRGLKRNKLKNIKKSVGTTWKQIEYTDFGKPKKINDSFGLAQMFDYDKNGNLTLKKSGSEKTHYVLNEKKQITQVNTDKVKLKLEYDERGRTTRVIASYESTLNDLAISYVDFTEKLETLELKGAGKISYSYDNDGSVTESSTQPTKTNDIELKTTVNRVYGIYTTLTDEAAVFGGID